MTKWFIVYEKWDKEEQRFVRFNDVECADLSGCWRDYTVWDALGFSRSETEEEGFAIVSLTKIGE